MHLILHSQYKQKRKNRNFDTRCIKIAVLFLADNPNCGTNEPSLASGEAFYAKGGTPKRVACDRTPVNKKYMPQPLFPVLNLPDFLLPVFNFRAQFLPGFLFRFCRGWSLFSICQHEKRQSISSDAFMGLLAFTHIPYRHYHSI